MKYPGAIWYPGPAPKRGYGGVLTGSKTGIVLHSAEGPWSAMQQVLLTGPTSWHFSVLKSGDVYQHYDWNTVCYHAGNRLANELLIGIEHEGKAGEPLTEPQLAASKALVSYLLKEIGVLPVRGQTLHEHNEVWNWAEPNVGPTSCPSNRIPWAAYMEERMYSDADIDRLMRWVLAGSEYGDEATQQAKVREILDGDVGHSIKDNVESQQAVLYGTWEDSDAARVVKTLTRGGVLKILEDADLIGPV